MELADIFASIDARPIITADYTADSGEFIYASTTVAIAQIDTIDTFTTLNNTAYTVTINGTPLTYTSDALTAQVDTVDTFNLLGNTAYTVTINGTPFTYTSDPYTAQVDTVTIDTVTDSTTYSLTINGTTATYTSGVGATAAEITAGLVAAINLLAEPVTAADGVGNFTITADVAGTAFATVITAGTMSVLTTTANSFPTIAEITAGLTSVINLGAEPVTAADLSTSVTLTADVAGTAFTATINANMAIATTTANNFATEAEIIAGIVAAVNAGAEPVTAANMTTYITLTADVAGVAFTATINANMVIATTTANKDYPFTITLPTAPNEILNILDVASSFAANNVTIDPGANTIMGSAGTAALSTNNSRTEMILVGTDWRYL